MWGASSITENSPTMLSDVKVRAAKAQAKRYRLHDADGLLLEVRPNGSKSWVLRYTEGGKRRRLAVIQQCRYAKHGRQQMMRYC